ncbi:MAG: hypothetical protein JWQ57_2941, partial [Mucilaginibacter sp.]|nr:hypothetical protein [Mucilaginibacter sp.]
VPDTIVATGKAGGGGAVGACGADEHPYNVKAATAAKMSVFMSDDFKSGEWIGLE